MALAELGEGAAVLVVARKVATMLPWMLLLFLAEDQLLFSPLLAALVVEAVVFGVVTSGPGFPACLGRKKPTNKRQKIRICLSQQCR